MRKKGRRDLLHLTIRPDVKKAAMERVGPFGSLSRLIEELLARELLGELPKEQLFLSGTAKEADAA